MVARPSYENTRNERYERVRIGGRRAVRADARPLKSTRPVVHASRVRWPTRVYYVNLVIYRVYRVKTRRYETSFDDEERERAKKTRIFYEILFSFLLYLFRAFFSFARFRFATVSRRSFPAPENRIAHAPRTQAYFFPLYFFNFFFYRRPRPTINFISPRISFDYCTSFGRCLFRNVQQCSPEQTCAFDFDMINTVV